MFNNLGNGQFDIPSFGLPSILSRFAPHISGAVLSGNPVLPTVAMAVVREAVGQEPSADYRATMDRLEQIGDGDSQQNKLIQQADRQFAGMLKDIDQHARMLVDDPTPIPATDDQKEIAMWFVGAIAVISILLLGVHSLIPYFVPGHEMSSSQSGLFEALKYVASTVVGILGGALMPKAMKATQEKK
uniref:Holin of 3TMs, for gene-transfer release n=1 Tax=Candidatus Kentrum sp. FM TaxID=2126340 RepID=A0A450RV15_9GAMM|nr:MAG: hypothetical protein BECKFM1743A_GA0114220_1000320 [Candidatus Kentron sp. FM]VFJ43662.1 MAG: hypothetical protein BECKFM1743C_GA0114222_1000320 [Candidatus Kentron sp. FM]VFK05657.1 MAG: hypothetical protein BECKFM1743B_GA0114221_1000320 [Candidatus Kentron sp. FM]